MEKEKKNKISSNNKTEYGRRGGKWKYERRDRSGMTRWSLTKHKMENKDISIECDLLTK